jgi:hypothetical protein
VPEMEIKDLLSKVLMSVDRRKLMHVNLCAIFRTLSSTSLANQSFTE